jgi:hypothetical protein
MFRLSIVAAVASLAFAVAAPAFAHGHRRHHHHHGTPHGRPADGARTFSGTCQLTGTVTFSPPLKTTPGTGEDFATESGTCSGTLTDRSGHSQQLSNASVGYVAWDQGLASCEAGSASGGGVLFLPGGPIRFLLNEQRATGGSLLQLTGVRGGSASGTANISPSANPVTIATECAGSGLASAPVDIDIATTPSISG